MTHTTGHWSIHAPAGSDTYLVAAGSQIVFAINKGTIPTREDARLIAAAPDLLAALRLMLREHDALQMAKGNTGDRWPAATKARAAIAKAIGEAA